MITTPVTHLFSAMCRGPIITPLTIVCETHLVSSSPLELANLIQQKKYQIGRLEEDNDNKETTGSPAVFRHVSGGSLFFVVVFLLPNSFLLVKTRLQILGPLKFSKFLWDTDGVESWKKYGP